jgi:hypothetical protein
MSKFAIIWELETVPDLAAFKRMHGTPDITDEEADALVGDKFAKPPLLLSAPITMNSSQTRFRLGASLGSRVAAHDAVARDVRIRPDVDM